MSRKKTIAGIAATLVTGVAIYCFFALKYPYHIHFQEQFQLFESTWEYFCSVVAVPGGLADWAGRFLTQFFYYAPAGAAVMAVLLCAVQLSVWACCRRKSPVVFALGFIPVVSLLVYYCDESALAGGAVAIILSLACAALCGLVNGGRRRRVLQAALVPVVYMACGPLAVIFVLVTGVNELTRRSHRSHGHHSHHGHHGRHHALPARVIYLAAAVAILALCPLIASLIFPYPLERLYLGVHYYRFHNILPGMLWVSALLCVLVVAAAAPESDYDSPWWHLPAGTVTFAAIAGIGAWLSLSTADSTKEEWMRYDFMVRMEMWNRIMMSADEHNPDNPTTVSCLNLALAKTGRMGDHMFEYFQNGPEGLLPTFSRNFTGPITTGEIFWHLGMVNTAQRYVFEAQEAIPDFQKSARCYKRLAETNIVNGDLDVARKYLKSLHNALFYRKWADETLALLDSGDVFDSRPELARARDFRLKEHDFLFSDTEMDSMLGLLNVENPSNTMAVDYLVAWCLLRKDLDRLSEVISLVTAPALPKACQEALMLKWMLTHSGFEGLPDYISSVYATRASQFIYDIQTGKPESEMRRLYGDTYWFYYYFRYHS